MSSRTSSGEALASPKLTEMERMPQHECALAVFEHLSLLRS